jgi:hypothetical protein
MERRVIENRNTWTYSQNGAYQTSDKKISSVPFDFWPVIMVIVAITVFLLASGLIRF